MLVWMPCSLALVEPFGDFSHGTGYVVVTNKPSAGHTAYVIVTWYQRMGKK